MAELIKQEASLVVFKVALSDAQRLQGTPGGVAQTNEAHKQSLQVVCELEITGDAEHRGFALPAGQLAAAKDVEAKIPQQRLGSDQPTGIARLLAQWCFSPQQTQSVGLWQRAKTGLSKIFSDEIPEGFAPFADWLSSGEVNLPSSVLDELKSLLATILRSDDSLWIEFSQPSGYLPLLPWEQMLRPATTMPILRLSPHPMKALSPNSYLSVVMCVTAPTKASVPTPEHMAVLVHSIRKSLPHGSQIHFAVRRDRDLGQVQIAGESLPQAPSQYAALGGFGPAGLSETELQVVDLAPPIKRLELRDPLPKVAALNGDAVIGGHGDISVPATWWALFQQIRVS